MLLQKDTLQELRERFKLNIYEIKIWASLLSRGVAAASELAEISGVPRSRCYDVLESLEKKGFIIMKIGKPIKYIAVQPEAVLERVKKGLLDEAKQQAQMIENLADTDIFLELEQLHKSGLKKVDAESITDYVVGKNNVNKLIKRLILKAKKQITLVTNEEGTKNDSKVLRKIFDQVYNKNLKIKFYSNVPSLDLGIEEISHTITRHNIRFVNIDNEEVLFIMSDENPEQCSAVWIKSPYFVGHLTELFEKSQK
jgi:HTH-type transcriptional regulator, sugar sensing transcriptional regulator